MTGRTTVAPRVAAWVRRLAVLLSVLAALVAVRGPVCTSGMASGLPAIPATAMSMMAVGTAAAAPVAMGSASMPAGWCPAMLVTFDRSTADLGSCTQTPPTVLNATGAAALAANREPGTAIALPAAAPSMLVGAVLQHAATLHQLGQLRT